ncbi:interferon-induced protein 44-like [Crassostrea angulata]|uniref:interferon-induced protein 44-like n=1 Tax=Magallana angulata TaxID=2784310 RepID=UPI0022B148D7|nr:interferon-induced protein 44-like [Crassostrea angulata]
MAELLTRKDKKQISQWIGRDSQFELLYKISRDGMSYQRFHELCDNKGPTATIFYNKDNNVYGGYLSDSWESTGGWCTDQRAFLFKLHSAGNWKPVMFPYTSGGTHFKSDKYGPWFYSLASCSNTVLNKSLQGYYPFYSQHYFFDGQRFDMKGETAQSVANGHNNVTDLEVYLVKEGLPDDEPESPWRDSPDWSSQTFQELKEFVANYNPLEEMKIPEVNILLIGQVGAGKSSFLNTINSIFKGEMSSRACTGGAENSLTKRFEKFRIRDPSTKKYLRFRICDTRGVEEDVSIKIENVGFILDGNIPNHYMFEVDSTVSKKILGFVKEPTVKDRIHVVVFVLDGSTLDVLSEGVVSKLKDIKSVVVDRGIPHLVFLTKIDKVCKLVEKDVSKTYKSSNIEDVIDEAAATIAIPRSQVLPVKNYEKETILNMDINILALTALKKSLVFADDFLENQYDWQQDNVQILNKRD